MTDLYYVRIRGSVVGPFRPEQVRQLVERGKIGRLHELSTDRQTWRALRDFPELAVPAATAAGGPSSPPAEDAQPAPGDAQPPPVSRQEWYYDEGGQPAGPVDEAGIAAMVASGRITPSTLVWTSGMKTWEPLQQTPLAHHATTPASGPARPAAGIGGNQPGDDPEFWKIGHAATSSIPWARAVCLISGILYGLFALANVISMLVGSSAMARVFSLLSLVYFLSLIVACGICFRYTSFLVSFRYSRRDSDLIKALETLRHFWQFSALVLIVALTFVVMVVLIIIAAGVDVGDIVGNRV